MNRTYRYTYRYNTTEHQSKSTEDNTHPCSDFTKCSIIRRPTSCNLISSVLFCYPYYKRIILASLSKQTPSWVKKPFYKNQTTKKLHKKERIHESCEPKDRKDWGRIRRRILTEYWEEIDYEKERKKSIVVLKEKVGWKEREKENRISPSFPLKSVLPFQNSLKTSFSLHSSILLLLIPSYIMCTLW